MPDPFKELRAAYERAQLQLDREFLAQIDDSPQPEPESMWDVLEGVDFSMLGLILEGVLDEAAVSA